MRRKFGDREACTRCGHDVEWHGRVSGWRDRGNGTECLPTGKRDQDGILLPHPKGRHTVRRAA